MGFRSSMACFVGLMFSLFAGKSEGIGSLTEFVFRDAGMLFTQGRERSGSPTLSPFSGSRMVMLRNVKSVNRTEGAQQSGRQVAQLGYTEAWVIIDRIPQHIHNIDSRHKGTNTCTVTLKPSYRHIPQGGAF